VSFCRTGTPLHRRAVGHRRYAMSVRCTGVDSSRIQQRQEVISEVVTLQCLICGAGRVVLPSKLWTLKCGRFHILTRQQLVCSSALWQHRS